MAQGDAVLALSYDREAHHDTFSLHQLKAVNSRFGGL